MWMEVLLVQLLDRKERERGTRVGVSSEGEG